MPTIHTLFKIEETKNLPDGESNQPTPSFPNIRTLFFKIEETKTTRMDNQTDQHQVSPTELQNSEEKTIVAVEKTTVAVPVRWPEFDTIIKVPAEINWLNKINEFEYEAGITFRGKYPYNSDCNSIWKLKKIGDKFIPIHSLLNK